MVDKNETSVLDYIATFYFVFHFLLGGIPLLIYQTLTAPQHQDLNRQFHLFCDKWLLGMNPFWSRTVKYHTPVEELNKSSHIYVMNHTCFADFLVCAGLGLQVAGVARGDLFKIPVAGPLFKNAGMLPVFFIKKENGRWGTVVEKTEAMMQRARHFLATKTSVLVLPEGKANLDEELAEFKPGFFRMARDEGVDVVPMAAWGSEKLWPMVREGRPRFPVGRGSASVCVGSPMPVLLKEDICDLKSFEEVVKFLGQKYFDSSEVGDWKSYLENQSTDLIESLLSAEVGTKEYEEYVILLFTAVVKTMVRKLRNELQEEAENTA